MNSIALLSAKIYPDKSFSVGSVPNPKKRRLDGEYDRQWSKQEYGETLELADWLIGTNTIEGKFQSLSENPNIADEHLRFAPGSEAAIEVLHEMDKRTNRDFSDFYEVEADLSAPLLVRSQELSQHSPKMYGSNGITSLGKRVCKNVPILLQQRFTKKRLGFATCTIPDVSKEYSLAILEQWGIIVKRFYQKLKRIVERQEYNFLYVGCTEIQEKRFNKTAIAVPHLHFVYLAKGTVRGDYYFNTEQAYTAWNEAVNEVLVLNGLDPIMGVGDHVGSVKLEPVKRSAAAYLGKYVSKGCKVVEAMQDEGYEMFPRQWWTAANYCKKMFRASIIRPSQSVCQQLFFNMSTLWDAGLIKYYQPIYIDWGGQQIMVGMVGTLSDEYYEYVKQDAIEHQAKKEAAWSIAA